MAAPSVTNDFSKSSIATPPFRVYENFKDVTDGLNSTTAGWDISVPSVTTPTLTVTTSLVLDYLTENTVV